LLSASGEQQRINIVCQPVHGDWSLLQQLTYIHFEHTELTFEVDSVELWLNQSSPFLQETGDLFSADPELALDQQQVMRRWQLLLTQLHNRLGDKSTEYLTLESEHWPEQLNHWQPATLQNKNRQDADQQGTSGQNEDTPENIDWIEQLDQHLAPRPSWLIDPPEILKQNHHQLFWQGPLKLLLGPERLQGQWWQNEDAQCRDYFIAEHHDYRRLWVYHDHKAQQWFLQGVFS
jgi:protein ImuB